MVSEENLSIHWTSRKALPREWIDAPLPADDVAGLPAAQDDRPLPRQVRNLNQDISMLALLKDENGGFVYGNRKWKHDFEDETCRLSKAFVEMRQEGVSEQRYPEVLTGDDSIGATPPVEKSLPLPGWRTHSFLLWDYDGQKVVWRMPGDAAGSKQVSKAADLDAADKQFASISIENEVDSDITERRQWRV